MAQSKWYVIGFTPDDIIMAGQDSRLALSCHEASKKCRARFDILQAAGDGEHLVYWFISDDTAQALDKESVSWRQFFVRECDAPPEGAFSVLVPGED